MSLSKLCPYNYCNLRSWGVLWNSTSIISICKRGGDDLITLSWNIFIKNVPPRGLSVQKMVHVRILLMTRLEQSKHSLWFTSVSFYIPKILICFRRIGWWFAIIIFHFVDVISFTTSLVPPFPSPISPTWTWWMEAPEPDTYSISCSSSYLFRNMSVDSDARDSVCGDEESVKEIVHVHMNCWLVSTPKETPARHLSREDGNRATQEHNKNLVVNPSQMDKWEN